MSSKVTNLSVYISFDNIAEKDLYTKLDLIIQFLLKNDLNGNVVLNRKDFIPDDYED